MTGYSNHVSRRSFAGGIAATVLTASAARAAGYPERPVHVIVPYAPGGSADFTGRLITQKMGEGLGQSFVVENRPGANGIIGAETVAKAAPDGYRLLVAPREMSINPALYKSLSFDTQRAFAWIGIATEGHFVLVVNPQVPAKSFAELVALAKAKPGTLTYGSNGNGSISHLNMEALKLKLGLDITHVPYRGAGPALTGTLTGEISMTLAAVPGALGFVQAGQMRALVVGSPQRMPQFPDVPTLAEFSTNASETFVPTFFGLAAPAGTPPAIVDALSRSLKTVVTDAGIAEKLANSGLTPVGGTPEAMAATMASDTAHFARLVQAIGLKIE